MRSTNQIIEYEVIFTNVKETEISVSWNLLGEDIFYILKQVLSDI